MKILLTGSDGFIGSNLVKALQDEHEITTLEKSYWDDKEQEVNWTVSQNDIILHIGAIADTTTDNEADLLYYNYTTTKKLFDACRLYGKKVVFASSASCYGKFDDPSRPLNLYGWTKYMSECYGYDLRLNLVSLRFFNVYGPGEDHKELMASVAIQAWKRGSFKLFMGKPYRDFVYIDDVVEAVIVGMKAKSGIYDVGTGEIHSFEEVLKLMGIEYTYRKDEPLFGYQYCTKAEWTNWMSYWKPKISLKEGIEKYKEYLNEV